MKKLIKEIIDGILSDTRWWISNNPILAVFVTGITSGLTATYAHLIGAGQMLDIKDFAIASAIFIIIFLMIAYTSRVTVCVLAASLLAAPMTRAQQPPPPPLPLIIGGILVIGLGGVVSCRAIKKCSKIAKGRTNAWPEELFFAAALNGGSFGASFSWAEDGYCVEERMLGPQVPVVTTLHISIASRTNATLTCSANCGEQYVQSYEEFLDESLDIGLTFGLSHEPQESFSLNRQPCYPEYVPISMDWGSQTICIGMGTIPITVYRSDNIVGEFKPLMRINASVNDVIEVQDATVTGAAFYRIEVGK